MSYTLEELQELVAATAKAEKVVDEPTEKGRTTDEMRAEFEALTKQLEDEIERSRHYECNKRIDALLAENQELKARFEQ